MEKQKTKEQVISERILNGRTLEIILRTARDKRLSVRVGQILEVPKVQGCSTLLLDYDSCRRPSVKGIRERLDCAGVRLVRTIRKRSPGGKGWHVIAVVRGTYDRFQCVALQAICESDPTREAANFYRAQIFGNKEWKARGNVLFKNSKG